MSKTRPQRIRVLDNVTPVVVISSTNATPPVITATAHGLVTGDTVCISGHATNVAANGVFHVTKVSDNTFSIQSWHDPSSDVVGVGIGSGGALYANPKVVYAGEWDSYSVQIGTAGSGNMTLKFAGTLMDMFRSEGNPGGTLSETNRYSFLDFVNDDGGGAIIDGDTGFVWAGTDAVISAELNQDGNMFIVPIITAWSAGSITCDLVLQDNL